MEHPDAPPSAPVARARNPCPFLASATAGTCVALLALLPLMVTGSASRRAFAILATESEVLQNGRFEEAGPDGSLPGWSPFAAGFRPAEGEGRSGSCALACAG